jgi:hypothetical protein
MEKKITEVLMPFSPWYCVITLMEATKTIFFHKKLSRGPGLVSSLRHLSLTTCGKIAS